NVYAGVKGETEGFNSATKLIFDVPSMKLTLFHVMVANHHTRKDTSSLNVIYFQAFDFLLTDAR
ncbi:hypothetical protein ED971_22495, partial [Salmonella enterica]|nr:hypothetical protein [Salmonella enterica]